VFKRIKMATCLGLSVVCYMTYAVEMNDPTKPSTYRETVAPNKKFYRLESVLLGHDRKLAIINGLSFSEGDNHKLGKVIAINSDHVVLQGSKRHILRLVTLSVKKKSVKKNVDEK